MSSSIYETTAMDLRNLDEEHAEICRRYEGLEEVILRQGSMHSIHGILTAAESLVQMMLQHLTHEEQLLVKLSRYSLQKRHRETKMKITTQLVGIKAELERGKVDPVFQLLRLGKVWIKEDMHLESEGGECEGSIDSEKAFVVHRALVDHPSAIAGLNG